MVIPIVGRCFVRIQCKLDITKLILVKQLYVTVVLCYWAFIIRRVSIGQYTAGGMERTVGYEIRDPSLELRCTRTGHLIPTDLRIFILASRMTWSVLKFSSSVHILKKARWLQIIVMLSKLWVICIHMPFLLGIQKWVNCPFTAFERTWNRSFR